MTDDDPGEAFDRAADRFARIGDSAQRLGPAGYWDRRSTKRLSRAVGRAVLVLLLLPAHLVASRQVTGLLITHLVLLAVLATKAVTAWLDSRASLTT